jgi:hypothetical protein
VIHVSFSARTDHIVNWYEDIFREIARKRELESAVDVHDALIRNRVIMNFNQEGIKAEQILQSLEAMITSGNFAAEAIVIDGFDFSKATSEDLQLVKDFAQNLDLEVWFSASLRGDEPLFNDDGSPLELIPFYDVITVLITLQFKGEYVHLDLVKDHHEIGVKDLHLRLDPKTLLIAEE